MKKLLYVVFVLIAGISLFASAATTEAKAEDTKTEKTKAQTTCPIMKGNKINKDLHTDVKGYRIYVCCPSCIAKVEADPDAAIKTIRENGEEPEKLPAK